MPHIHIIWSLKAIKQMHNEEYYFINKKHKQNTDQQSCPSTYKQKGEIPPLVFHH